MYMEKISICEKRARGIVSGKLYRVTVMTMHCTKDDRLMIKENKSLRHSVTKGKQTK